MTFGFLSRFSSKTTDKGCVAAHSSSSSRSRTQIRIGRHSDTGHDRCEAHKYPHAQPWTKNVSNLPVQTYEHTSPRCSTSNSYDQTTNYMSVPRRGTASPTSGKLPQVHDHEQILGYAQGFRLSPRGHTGHYLSSHSYS